MPGRAGWHVACAPWLAAREVAVIGADTAQDVAPSGYPDLRSPLHLVGIVAMGLWLIDNCDLEALAVACARRDRWAFHLTVAPLRLTGVTGSPVNPLATFSTAPVCRSAGGQTASTPISPVRMRTARSTGRDPDLAVADLAGPGRPGDDLGDLLRLAAVARAPRS